MSEVLSVRIPRGDIQELDFLSKEEKKRKADLLRELVREGLKIKRIGLALEKFRNKEITVWKAARIADVPLTQFLDILREKRVEFNYTEKELEEDFQLL